MDKLKICTICQTLIQENIPQQICLNCSFILKQNDQQYSVFFQQNICPSCTYKNNPESIQCIICENVFQDKIKNQQFLQSNKILNTLVYCPQCFFENTIQSQSCLQCEAQIDLSTKKQCPICKQQVKQINFFKHKNSCQLSQSLIQKQTYQNKKLISIDSLKKVQNSLQKSSSILSQQVKQKDERMTALQIKALKYMRQKSAKQHKQIKKQLDNRIIKLGFRLQDLQNLRFYIANYAPIIIQIHVSKHMQFFVKDTHYRNQFQTNKSSGVLSKQTRIKWQDRMFDKNYSNATDFQRVKYGVINFTNDPKGVLCAKVYGPSYLLLKDHVRKRCTFTDKDSSNTDCSIASLDFCYQIINKLNDKQLKAAFNASKALQQSSGVLLTYKQIQIHGPVQFSKDIERIYVNRAQIKDNKELLDLVYQFSNKHKIEHDFI